MIHPVKKRGFTLVELIVVIAIVAILAAVSIVGYQSYINKARLSNDVTDAKNMTNVLQAYMLSNNLDEVDPAEIRAIVNIDNDYSFIPRAEGYSFWYEEETRTITIKSTYEAMSEGGDFTELTGQTQQTLLLNDPGSSVGANDPASGDALEELIDGYYLLDRGGSDVADAIFTIRNLKTVADFDAVINSLDGWAYDVLEAHILTFDPETTLFINDFFGFTASGNDEATKVIFADAIEVIPASALSTVTTLPATLKIPASVVVIESGAFRGLTATTLVYDNIASITVEDDAFSDSDTLNTALMSKQGTARLEELTFTVNYAQEITRVYQVTFPSGVRTETYAGKRIKTGEETYDYYNVQGELLTEGAEYTTLVGYFSDSTYLRITTRETDINLNLEPTLDGTSTGSVVYAVHVTYRENSSKVIAEAKAYDVNGNLMAKGTITSLRLVTQVELPETATITFELNGGTGINETMTRFIGETTTSPVPIKDGFIFDGWYTDIALTTPYVFDIMGSSDLTLYAKWV